MLFKEKSDFLLLHGGNKDLVSSLNSSAIRKPFKQCSEVK